MHACQRGMLVFNKIWLLLSDLPPSTPCVPVTELLVFYGNEFLQLAGVKFFVKKLYLHQR